MALKGTLKDFPITDIFQLADQQGKTGVLLLDNKRSEVRVMFFRGKVVGAAATGGKDKEPLGAMLVRSGLITAEQLEAALESQKKNLRKLGMVLIAENMISSGQLRQFLALQTQETIYRLFLWRSGSYEFLNDAPQYEKELATPMSAQHLVMDSLRMIDEWPAIRKQITGLDGVAGRVPENELKVTAEAPDSGGGTGDADIDAAFAAWDDVDSTSSSSSSTDDGMIRITPSQMKVWELVDGVRTVQEIVDRSLLGEFNTAKALSDLVALDVVRVIGRRRSQTSTNRVSSLPGNRRRKLVRTVWGITLSLGLLAVAGAALFFFQLTTVAEPLVSQRQGVAPARTLAGSLETVRQKRLDRAMDVYWLLEGKDPTHEDLVEAGLVRSTELPQGSLGLAGDLR